MMKKGTIVFKLFFASLCLSLLLVTGCGPSDNKNQGAQQTLPKVLKVGTNATFVPFEFQNEQTKDYDGYDIELIRAIAQTMGVKLEFRNISFDALVPSLLANDIDLAVSGMTITKERKEKILFSAPYYESGQAILLKGSDTSINTLNDLKNHTIAVQMATTAEDLARGLKGANVKVFDNSNEAILELKIGGVTATIVDLPVAQYYLSKHKDENIRLIEHKSDNKEYFGIGMKKDNTFLKEKIDQAILKLKASGEFDKIYKKWFHQNAPTMPES